LSHLVILDTNCILAGFQFDNTKKYYSVPEAFEEIKRGEMGRTLAGMLERGVFEVRSPSSAAMEAVSTAALGTGDWERMSRADRALVALAKELEGVLVSDDYSMQNVARVLGIEFRSFGKPGIRETITWGYRCRGCGRWYESQHKDCPICGSEVVMKPTGGKKGQRKGNARSKKGGQAIK